MKKSTTTVSIRDVNRVMFKHLRPHWVSGVVTLVAIALAAGTQIAVPWVYKVFFDVLIGDVPPFYGDVASTLVALVLIVFGINTLGNVFWRTAGVANAHLQPAVMRDLDKSSYDYLMGHSYRFFTNSFTGGLVRKVRRLSNSIERIMDQFEWHFLSLTISITGIVIVVWMRSPLLALMIIAWIGIFAFMNWVFSKWKLKYDETRSEVDSEVTAVLADGVTNSLNVKLFDGHAAEMQRFADVAGRFKKLQTFTWGLNEINNALQGLLVLVLEFGVMYYAIQMWSKGLLTVGDFALLQGYLVIVIHKTWDIGRWMRDTYESYAEAKEMVAVLNMPHEIRNVKRAKPLEVTKGKIQFEKVEFRYAKTRKVLDKLSVTIKPREKVALVGPSGAGKSTIVKLLLRFFDVQRGKILIDGQVISKVTQESLRRQVALVPQEPILFHRTIMENIRYGRRGATDEEVMEAAKKARCHTFIEELPEKYETFVGERGVKLSGGERQRVAIARAILANAPILILDEATSSLDSESELLIQQALEELMKERTTIVIAHRLSTIMKMDRILVIDDGKLVDQGTHKQLTKKKGIYRDLWDIQAGGFMP